MTRFSERARSFIQEKKIHLTGLFIFILFLSVLAQGLRIAYVNPSADFFSPASRSDFDDYHTAARFLAEGKDPYRTDQMESINPADYSAKDIMNPAKLAEIARKLRGVGTYLYPPFLAWVLRPIAFESYEQAALKFQILSFLALLSFFGFYYIIKSLSVNISPPVFLTASAFSSFLLYRFILENYTNGNIGFFLIFLIGAGLILAWKKGILWQMTGGFLIGLATVLKVTPVYMGLVLLAGRRWNAILGAVLGGLIGLAAPALTSGLSGNHDMLMNWKSLILEQYSKNVIVRPWANNQTISAAAGKFFIPLSDNKQLQYGLPLINREISGTGEKFSGIKNGVKAVNYTLTLILLGAAVFLAWKGKLAAVSEDITENRRFSYFLSAAILISLVVSGVSWYHTYSLLLLPVLFLSVNYFYKKENGAPLQLSRFELSALSVIGFFGVIDPMLPDALKSGLALYSVFTFLAIAVAAGFLYYTFSELSGSGGRENN